MTTISTHEMYKQFQRNGLRYSDLVKDSKSINIDKPKHVPNIEMIDCKRMHATVPVSYCGNHFSCKSCEFNKSGNIVPDNPNWNKRPKCI